MTVALVGVKAVEMDVADNVKMPVKVALLVRGYVKTAVTVNVLLNAMVVVTAVTETVRMVLFLIVAATVQVDVDHLVLALVMVRVEEHVPVHVLMRLVVVHVEKIPVVVVDADNHRVSIQTVLVIVLSDVPEVVVTVREDVVLDVVEDVLAIVLVPPIVTYSVVQVLVPMVPFVLPAAGVTVVVHAMVTVKMAAKVYAELLVRHIVMPPAWQIVVNLVTDVPIVVILPAPIRVETIVPVLSLLA